MDSLSPFAKQMLVASSAHLAGLSVGGIIGYPNVILEQFKNNGSIIQADMEVSTWMGSVHGLAGIPSILMPTLMQWKGRKTAFIISCLLIITGWILIFIANNTTIILIAEALHGLGANSMLIVCFSITSEMIDPKFRLISMSFYAINENFGISMTGIIGRYLHWKTVAAIVSVPIVVALAVGIVCPESPSWLAYKGKFKKCKKSFVWLRGTDERSSKELNVLINIQRENRNCLPNSYNIWKIFLEKIRRRDFYIPCFQTFVCFSLFYNSGTIVIIIYAIDIIRRTTGNEVAALYGMITIDVILFLGCFSNVFLLKLFNNKSILLSSALSSALFLFLATLVTFMQYEKLLPMSSLLCLFCLIGFVMCNSLGIATMCFTVSAELMPVKHKDLGGALYVFLACFLHFVSLKVSPYLFLYLKFWGTFLIFTINTICCSFYIWKYVPETKNRTLQEIEDFYNNNGRFIQRIEYYDEADSYLLNKK